MEFEVKYYIDQLGIPDVEYWLDRVLTPDPVYPDSIVSNIYFDSYGLKSYREKLDGDYLKTKYRIRWYETPGIAKSKDFHIVAQIKRKIGRVRIKESVPIKFNPSWLQSHCLASIDTQEISDCQQHFYPMNYPPEEVLYPSVLISYRRKRYLESMSGLRVCLDYNIEAKCFGAHIGNSRAVYLHNGILEIKGESEGLPQALQPLLSMGCRKTAFSKYSSCLQQFTQDGY